MKDSNAIVYLRAGMKILADISEPQVTHFVTKQFKN